MYKKQYNKEHTDDLFRRFNFSLKCANSKDTDKFTIC